MQKITSFLWFKNQAEEAGNFYSAIFQNSKIVNVAGYDEASAKASARSKGKVLTITFDLEG